MQQQKNPWPAGAILCVFFGAAAWFAPIDEHMTSAKHRFVLELVNAVVVPLDDLAGKEVMVALAAALCLFCLWRALGFAMPVMPRIELPRREARFAETPDLSGVPMQRRRDLRQVTTTSEAEPVAVPAIGLFPTGSPLAERANVEYLAACVATPFAEGSLTLADLPGEMARSWSILHKDAPLDPRIVEKAIVLVQEMTRRQTPHGEKVDPIAIVRKPRDKVRDWSEDRSWLGGLPKLGDAPWPRGKDGEPLHFVAQIDLAELHEASPKVPLPAGGSLAFFIGSGAVIHVPAGVTARTAAPHDLKPSYGEDDYPLPERASRVTHQAFPFWPVEPIRLTLPDGLDTPSDDGENHEDIYEAQTAALHAKVAPREYSLSPYTLRQADVPGADMLWWYGADLVLRQLRDALDYRDAAIALRNTWIEQAQGYQARLAAEAAPTDDEIAKSREGEERNRQAIPNIVRQAEELAEFAEHFAAFVAGRTLWEAMTEDEIAVIEDVLRDARKRFPDLCTYKVVSSMDDLRSACLRRMMTGEAAAVQAMPDTVLDYINRNYRLPTQNPHQMFGLGGCKQYALYDHMCDHLLLQLGPDEMAEMSFGDMGIWQFWISPEDLAAGRFDKAQLTFECA